MLEATGAPVVEVVDVGKPSVHLVAGELIAFPGIHDEAGVLVSHGAGGDRGALEAVGLADDEGGAKMG